MGIFLFNSVFYDRVILLSVFHYLSQMSYSLVVILELNSISEVQYKEIMIIGNK